MTPTEFIFMDVRMTRIENKLDRILSLLESERKEPNPVALKIRVTEPEALSLSAEEVANRLKELLLTEKKESQEKLSDSDTEAYRKAADQAYGVATKSVRGFEKLTDKKF